MHTSKCVKCGSIFRTLIVPRIPKCPKCTPLQFGIPKSYSQCNMISPEACAAKALLSLKTRRSLSPPFVVPWALEPELKAKHRCKTKARQVSPPMQPYQSYLLKPRHPLLPHKTPEEGSWPTANQQHYTTPRTHPREEVPSQTPKGKYESISREPSSKK